MRFQREVGVEGPQPILLLCIYTTSALQNGPNPLRFFRTVQYHQAPNVSSQGQGQGKPLFAPDEGGSRIYIVRTLRVRHHEAWRGVLLLTDIVGTDTR